MISVQHKYIEPNGCEIFSTYIADISDGCLIMMTTSLGGGIYTVEKPQNVVGSVAKAGAFCKRHWKKAAIATPIVGFLLNLGYNRYQEELMVVEACKRAKKYGQQVRYMANIRQLLLWVKKWITISGFE